MADMDSIKQLAKDAVDRGTGVVRSDEVRESLGRVGRGLADTGKELVGTAKAAGRAWTRSSDAEPGTTPDEPSADPHDPVI